MKRTHEGSKKDCLDCTNQPDTVFQLTKSEINKMKVKDIRETLTIYGKHYKLSSLRMFHLHVMKDNYYLKVLL